MSEHDELSEVLLDQLEIPPGALWQLRRVGMITVRDCVDLWEASASGNAMIQIDPAVGEAFFTHVVPVLLSLGYITEDEQQTQD